MIRYRGTTQETHLSWDDYRLDVRCGGVLMYSVQVFMLQGGELGRSLYMVEFRRGHMDIFEFKDYYRNVIELLSQHIKDDERLSRLNASLDLCSNPVHRPVL